MQETQVWSLGFLPGKSHGQSSLVGYSPWGLKRVEHNLVTKQQSVAIINTVKLKWLFVKKKKKHLRRRDVVLLVVTYLPNKVSQLCFDYCPSWMDQNFSSIVGNNVHKEKERNPFVSKDWYCCTVLKVVMPSLNCYGKLILTMTN